MILKSNQEETSSLITLANQGMVEAHIFDFDSLKILDFLKRQIFGINLYFCN